MPHDRDALLALARHANVVAFSRTIREKESNQIDDGPNSAYTLLWGGEHFHAPPWAHPWHGKTTGEVGHSTACGAGQFLGTTWANLVKQYNIPDFSPPWQDFGIVALIAGRGALEDVLAGRFEAAVAKCRPEWTSLPGASESRAEWTMAKAKACYQSYGGTVSQPTVQISAPPTTTTGGTMGPLALLQMFGPLLSGLIPQVKNIIQPPPDSNASRNVDLAQLLINTLISAAQTAGAAIPPTPPTATPGTTEATQNQLAQLAATVTAMQSDAEVQKKVVAAVLTEPTIQGLLEVGGGIKAARDFGIAVQQAEKPFWMNPTFVVTALFFPMMYLIVIAVLFTVRIDTDTVEEAVKLSWWALVGFDQSTRSGLVNLIVGMVIGGVVGVWFGTSYGSQRKTELAATATEKAVESK